MPVIIDTTVWIDFFRSANTDQTDLLEVVVRRGEAALGDVIISEVLQGVASEQRVSLPKAPFFNLSNLPNDRPSQRDSCLARHCLLTVGHSTLERFAQLENVKKNAKQHHHNQGREK